MNQKPKESTSRREFLKRSSGFAATSALAGVAIPHVHAGEDNTIRLALVGAGGRGTGAVLNALSVKNGPIKLVAMADVFQERLAKSYRILKERIAEESKAGDGRKFSDLVDVPRDRQFVGFDGYRRAMGLLGPGDIAILTTPPAFRWVHFGYAIEKDLNVFMEKPVTVDGPSTRKMLALGRKSVAKNLKVGVGLMCRHCRARRELYNRIRGGEIGDLIALRAYRVAGPTGSAFSGAKPEGISELLYQIKRFHSFLWASGGSYSDFLIHNIDESCWMKDGWPVRAKATGGRHYRGDSIDQNFDSYSVEYTFADGAKLFLEGRTMPRCWNEFASYAHGSMGSAVISTSGHIPALCRIYKGQNQTDEDPVWSFPQPEPNPYQLEWDDLVEAIRGDKPFNEVKRGAEASLVTSMGRMAAHTGQIVTWDDILKNDHEFAPGVDQLTLNSKAPLQLGPDGKYPFPQPGITTAREY